MSVAYDYLTRILHPTTPPEQRLPAIRSFAQELGWTPSYELPYSIVADAIDHIVVEHGLENAAVLSFLQTPRQPVDLGADILRSLLTLSYNNLVEWHLFVSESQVRYVSNRTSPHVDIVKPLARDATEVLSDKYFSRNIADLSRRTNVPSCDDQLINVVSRWKRLLKADYRDALNNAHISTLVNAIIFVRACEDYAALSAPRSEPILLRLVPPETPADISLFQILSTASRDLGFDVDLTQIFPAERLSPFDRFDRETARELFRDFYRPSMSPFDFNFAFMSKHALSRIYERFVSLLEFEDTLSSQLSFLTSIPAERRPEKTGAVYTPQFIAGFFTRYLRDNMTPRALRSLRFIDPACGSGIFARTMLEMQCDPMADRVSVATIDRYFDQTCVIDKDDNACEATRLSLSLLHLIATGNLPARLNVICANAVEMAMDGRLLPESFGAVVANPPYVKHEHLGEEERRIYDRYLEGDSVSRVDSYLAFVKLSVSLVSPGGFVCLVLPHAFLLADNARYIRKRISADFDVRCLVDLAAVPVFENFGIYNVLLVLERRLGGDPRVPAQIVRCQDFAGAALQACLEGKTIETPYYSIFDVGQEFFDREKWVLLGARELSISVRLSRLKPLSKYLGVRQGVVTGADTVFIRPWEEVEAVERAVYRPFLPDRQIFRYQVPDYTDQAMFYPFVDEGPVDAEVLRTEFPKTWEYLGLHRDKLAARASVRKGEIPWWRPTRPRDPKVMLGPKIVGPHLMLTPRFAVDLLGRYVVTRSPFIHPLERYEEEIFLKLMCAVLNSSVTQWYISMNAYKYGGGYNRIEVPLLRTLPVPDPAAIAPALLNGILALVDRAIREGPSREVDIEIDDAVIKLYELTEWERKEVTGRWNDA